MTFWPSSRAEARVATTASHPTRNPSLHRSSGIGDGRITKDGKRRGLQVKVGDQVLFTSYAGDEFKIDGEKKVLLMREDDILAVVD